MLLTGLDAAYRLAVANEASAAKREKRAPRSLIGTRQAGPIPTASELRQRQRGDLDALEKNIANLEGMLANDAASTKT